LIADQKYRPWHADERTNEPMTDLSEYVEKLKTVLQPVTPQDQKMYTLRNEGFKCRGHEERHEIRVRGTT